ncbi:hypothetical protein RB614_40350 [Phytohabitans sp. ZYX-F-186]|uniref:DUF7715 domain-containing protein n=1 Tax=Phytohabitans maris TaxID=3071409 RepID=A0ABU0ZVE4_9ACTN|nr:hypothetical protein [Phytohabitans sp. ZYX-F-186]MDQ7910761.1 hypothetical protein [Phytohabitans sp. ZYX-F-186]
MRVLVASRGDLAEDYCWTVAGELVAVVSRCEDVQCSLCDLCVAFVGVGSARATTVARVADVAITRDAYVEALHELYVREGVECTVDEAREEAEQLLALASTLAPGALVRRHGDELRQAS